jgi:hypothetical protein
MRYQVGAIAALSVVGGILVWRNRFAIQRRLEAIGINTPLLEGSVSETAKSIASKARGKMKHGATLAEREVNQRSAG